MYQVLLDRQSPSLAKSPARILKAELLRQLEDLRTRNETHPVVLPEIDVIAGMAPLHEDHQASRTTLERVKALLNCSYERQLYCPAGYEQLKGAQKRLQIF